MLFCTFQELLEKMMKAEGKREAVLKDLARRIFEKFSSHFDKWNEVVNCVSLLDILASLAEYARLQSYNMVMPTLVQPEKHSKVNILNSKIIKIY